MVTTGLRQEGRRPGHNPSEADGVLPVGCVFSAFTLLWLDLEFFPDSGAEWMARLVLITEARQALCTSPPWSSVFLT